MTEIRTTVVDMKETTLYDKNERVFLTDKHNPSFFLANITKTLIGFT